MAHNIIMYITVIIISYYAVHSIIITSKMKRLASNGSGNRGTEVAQPAQELSRSLTELRVEKYPLAAGLAMLHTEVLL